MKKITKKHYNRKLLLFGIMLFVSIALISTGFAAFVISTNSTNASNGNINVGKVQEASLQIVDVTCDYDSFLFEPEETDVTGRVRNDGRNFERLAITISGEVHNSQYLDRLTIKLTVPETVKKAADEGYIVLPESINEIEVETFADTDQKTNVVDFEYTIEFEWGEAFGEMNPGNYFDEDIDGLQVKDAEMKTKLDSFRMAMYGLEDVNDDIQEGNNIYIITVSAFAN